MESKLSVVVTSYNRPTKLLRMIKSALNQTIAPEEIVVINDGSTIDYSDVKQWALNHPKLVWMDIENAGVSKARNSGVLTASSSFIAFCDDDDYFLPNHIQILKNRIQAESQAKGLYHTHRIELRHSETSEPAMSRKHDHMTWQEHYITNGEMIPSCTCMHRDVAIQFPFPEGIKYAEDHEQRLLAMSSYACFPIYERTVVMDRTDESATNRSVFEISKIYRDRFKKIFANPSINSSIHKKYRNQMLFRWTSLELSELRQNKRKTFLVHWLRTSARIRSISNLKSWLIQGWWFFSRD